MNRVVVFLSILLLAALFVTIPHHRSVAASNPADPAALLKADRDFDAATAARGQEGFASFISDDMTTLEADQAIVSGKDNFVVSWKPVFDTPGLSLRWQPKLARISGDGTLGFTVGEYTTTRTENGASRKSGSGKYITVWRKQSAGSWKVTFDSGVPDTPPAPAAKP